MKNIRLILFVVLLAVLFAFGAQAQAVRASQQLAINRPSVGLQQAATPVITVNVTANVTAQINNPAQPAPSSGSNTGLILIIIVVVLVLIILVGILISSRRPTDV